MKPMRAIDVGAFELARQLGLPPPPTQFATPAEAAKRKQLQAEIDADLAAPLIQRREP